MSVGCIIPFYNERGRIGHVVTSLLQSRHISQIICIDDGSVDDGHKELEALSSKVKVVRHPLNHGKSGAVKTGLKYVAAETVLMMDADLYDIDINDLDRAIVLFEQAQDQLMLIFQMEKFLPAARFFRGNILFSGIRLIRTRILTDFFQNQDVHRYQLELAMNHYFLKKHLPVVHYRFYANCALPLKKLGVFHALKRDFHTYPDAILKVGLDSYLKQIIFFCRTRIK